MRQRQLPNLTNVKVETEEEVPIPLPTPSSSTADANAVNNDGHGPSLPQPPKRRITALRATYTQQQIQQRIKFFQQCQVKANQQRLQANTVAKKQPQKRSLAKEKAKDIRNSKKTCNNKTNANVKTGNNKTNANAAGAHDDSNDNYLPVRKRLQFIVKNCPELFKQNKFELFSDSTKVLGFQWVLQVSTEKKGFLNLGFHAEPPKDFHGNYRIEVDFRLSILNVFAGKDLMEEEIGVVYDDKRNTGKGYQEMAKFADLLDSTKGFLTPNGSIEIWADFTIKSSTLSHLT